MIIRASSLILHDLLSFLLVTSLLLIPLSCVEDDLHHCDLGTYNQVPKIEWSNLQAHEFGEPNWVAMYPINSKSGQPSGVLPPRLACKLFHDGIYLINKAEENPKFYQDRLPECCIKFYKKKQFRKQCIEAGKRVICRLARGMGIAPNCVADEIFMYVVLKDAFDLGWRRIAQHIENIPETEKDKDYGS